MKSLSFKWLKRTEEALASFIDRFLGTSTVGQNEENSVQDIFKDKYVKSTMENMVCSPVSHTVWVNGQSYAIMANTPPKIEVAMPNVLESKSVTASATTEML